MIRREIFDNILSQVNNKLIILLTGARQVGKTTILKQLQKILKEKVNTYFLNLEDPQIKSLLNFHPNKLFEITGSQKDEKQIIFIDEIHYYQPII